uniref:G-protein coupled receptors family 1 profile domain-containing protein n=1 Tax=Tetraodon nigroviridis TaxID=99883 RepID=H3CR90_TETNG
MRQVSQAKRWDDLGPGRHTLRQSRVIESLDFPDEEFSVNLGIDTMAIKKRSSRTRRIRPVSSRLSDEEASPSPTPPAPPHPAPLTHSASWECLSTLPTNGSPLRHVTHVRPRPPRRHPAGHLPSDAQYTENGGVSMLEDGLPDFYSKRVLPDSQLSSLHQAQSLRRKKRRSVLSIFSGFRRNRNSTICNQESDNALENVYSMIQHPKDAARPDSAVPGANGSVASPRSPQDAPGQGVRAASPPCLIQRQSTDLVSMVYSCIGAEIEDSDGSSTSDTRATAETERLTTVSEAPADTRSNGHVVPSRQQTDRQTCRQERIVPLAGTQAEVEEDAHSGGGTRPEPPPQSTKPSLAIMRQRHLQDSLEEAGRLREEEDQSEKRPEDRPRVRGQEGQRPLIPNTVKAPCFDKTSPEKEATSPSSLPGEESTGEQRSFPPAQPTIQEEERKSPPAPAKAGIEAGNPPSQDEEGQNGFSASSHPARKPNSVDTGMDPGIPSDLDRSSDRRVPVSKPCFPQYRNRSLDCPAGTRCYESPRLGNKDWLFFLVPAFLVYYVAPLLCIAINCGLIISHLRRCRATLAADRRNKKATALLIASTVVFAISWLPYYALEFVNVTSHQFSSAAFPLSRFARNLSSTLSPLYLTPTSLGPTGQADAGVSLWWEVASLIAILLVCLAPCWNPPLYFLLSRPAVRQLRAMLPSFFHKSLARKPVQGWRIAPAPPSRLPHVQKHSLTHQTHTQTDSVKLAQT